MTIDPAAAAAVPPAPSEPTAPSATDPAAELARLQAENAALKAESETWKGHSRTWEQRAKQNGDARTEADKAKGALVELAKQFGIVEDKPIDPETLSRQAAAIQAERAQLARERAVLLAATASGADANALLDSRTFLAQLEQIDPSDPAAVEAAVKAAVETNDRYKLAAAAPATPATPPAPPARQASSPGQFNGSPGQARQLGEADFKNMSGAELNKAMKAGLFDAYLNSPNA